jgi:hypothetical protein
MVEFVLGPLVGHRAITAKLKPPKTLACTEIGHVDMALQSHETLKSTILREGSDCLYRRRCWSTLL